MQEGKLHIETRGDNEIVVRRDFDAPRQLIWDAYTQPDLIKRWLTGPDGWTMPVCEVDLRVGGAYRYVWRKDDGTEMAAGGLHREIVAPSRLVVTQVFESDPTMSEAINILELAENAGRTTMTATLVFPSRQHRDGALASGMTRGMEAGYARLEQQLTEAAEG
jgi:uncharacterized protein YndB with AHSA1/START domain